MEKSFFDFDTPEFKTVNGLSIAGSGLTLLYSSWLYYKRPAYIDRVSLRIQTLLACLDIVRHFIYLFNTSLSNGACKLIAFLFFFCFHTNTFLNMAIAANLQKLYIHEKLSSTRFVRALYVIPIFAALLIDLVPFIFGAYGRNSLNACFLIADNAHFEALKILLLYSTNYSGLIYCVIIPVILMVKICITKPDFGLNITAQSPLARKLALRISLYPLFCFICHSGSIVFNISLSLKYPHSQMLFTWLLIGQGINGVMNFICFILDPYIVESIIKSTSTFFEPIKPEPEIPSVLPSIEQDRRRFESDPPSEENVPDLSTSDTSSIESRDILTPHFLRTPVNSYSHSEPIHFLTDALTIEENIIEQMDAEAFQQTQVPHDVLRFY